MVRPGQARPHEEAIALIDRVDSEALDEDGWMASGDLVRLDGAGYCRVVGRLKDIIIRNMGNIYCGVI